MYRLHLNNKSTRYVYRLHLFLDRVQYKQNLKRNFFFVIGHSLQNNCKR